MSARLWFGLASVPLALALGALGSHLIFPALIKPAAVALQPVAVVTGWGVSGLLAWLVYAATIAVAGAGYLAVIDEIRSRPIARGAIVAIVAASILAAGAAFAFRFLFSSDVYAYAAYGGFAATGHNPYRVHTFPPATVVNDRWTAAIGFEWPSMPACAYGPAFVEILRLVVVATHAQLATTILILRAIAIASFIASIALLPRADPGRGVLLAALVGLNPVVITTVTEGHYDALVFLMVLCGAIAARTRPLAGGILTGASVVLKATGLVAALALGYAFASRRFIWGALGAVAAAVVVQAIAIGAAGGLQLQAPTDWVGSKPAAVAIALRGLLALLVTAIALHNAGTGARARVIAGAALVIWIVNPTSYPWYGIWLLPLAAFTIENPEGPALVAVTFCSVLRYLSDVYGFAPAAPWLGLAAAGIPVGVLITPMLPAAWRTRTAEKTIPT